MSDPDTFGNAKASYVKAGYSDKGKDIGVRTNAYNKLKEEKIQALIQKTLDATFSEKGVDREHAKLVFQDKDLNVKARAIDMYNKLQGRIKTNVEISHKRSNPLEGIETNTILEYLKNNGDIIDISEE